MWQPAASGFQGPSAQGDLGFPHQLRSPLWVLMVRLAQGQKGRFNSLTVARQPSIFFGDARGFAKKADGTWAKEGIGGVLFKAGTAWYFMIEVDSRWDKWLGPEGDQRINAAEGLPLLLAMGQGALRGIDPTVYIDNTAAEWTLRRPPLSASGKVLYIHMVSQRSAGRWPTTSI